MLLTIIIGMNGQIETTENFIPNKTVQSLFLFNTHIKNL